MLKSSYIEVLISEANPRWTRSLISVYSSVEIEYHMTGNACEKQSLKKAPHTDAG